MKEDYVSFECAKLLKEKGFNEYVEWAYRYFAENNICVIHINEKPASTLIENCYPYVTLQMVMKWLRNVKKIIISIAPTQEIDCKHLSYVATIQRIFNKYELRFEEELYENSYEEACEASIKYCLTNLI